MKKFLKVLSIIVVSLDETLPAPKQLAQAEIDTVGEEIQKSKEVSAMPRLFKFLYDLLF